MVSFSCLQAQELVTLPQQTCFPLMKENGGLGRVGSGLAEFRVGPGNLFAIPGAKLLLFFEF
jgi:hypothetical protein